MVKFAQEIKIFVYDLFIMIIQVRSNQNIINISYSGSENYLPRYKYNGVALQMAVLAVFFYVVINTVHQLLLFKTQTHQNHQAIMVEPFIDFNTINKFYLINKN